MPFINIKMVEGRTLAQKQELADAFTREAVKILDVKPEWVTVVIDEYPRENWATAGQLHVIKYGEGFGKQGTEKQGPADAI
ncbi:MAG: 4-oxalocrotonate tautomerase [Firmicutes bacterium]|nr:4-oxalocrotonate tautomerase [Bacillota bacterium]